MLEETAHDKTSAGIAKVVLPAVHWVAKALKFTFFQSHSRVEVIGILLRQLVHVTEAREAVVPRNLARLVKEQAALRAATVLELPCANGASIDAVLLVADNVQ